MPPLVRPKYVPRHAVSRRLGIATTAALGAAAVVGGVLVAADPGTAGAWPGSTVTITGHGYGHGRGMSQYGAFGYATLYGWNYQQILGHYYGGTTLGTAANTPIRVAISSLEGSTSLSVTSGVAFSAGGVRVPAGSAATLGPAGSGYRVVVRTGGCTGRAAKPVATSSNTITPGTSDPNAGPGALLEACGNGMLVRGSLSWVAGDHVVNTLPVESYLRGSVPHESPASWGDAAGGKGMAALQAQAVAARTYALNQHRYSYADICDNQNCQMYTGAGQNGQLTEDSRSNAAVASTAGRVLRDSSGSLVSAEYSSSSGGYTAGGAFPAVPDLGDVTSPNHNWTATVSAASVAGAYGVGTLHGLVVTSRNGLGADGGRVNSIRVIGSSGTVVVTGNQFASDLGLRSNWFSIAPPQQTPYLFVGAAGPVTPATAFAHVTTQQPLGTNGDVPLACDFSGSGKDGAAFWRSGVLYYRASLGGTGAFTAARIGKPGDVPICGDFNGDGKDEPGVYRSATRTFYLANAARPTSLRQVLLGQAGDLPVVGDWFAAGHDSVGVYRPSTQTFYLLRSLTNFSAFSAYRFGRPGDVPVSGNWAATGPDRIGVFRAGVFYLAPKLGATVANPVRFGLPGDVPLLGDWTGTGRDQPAVGRYYTQY